MGCPRLDLVDKLLALGWLSTIPFFELLFLCCCCLALKLQLLSMLGSGVQQVDGIWFLHQPALTFIKLQTLGGAFVSRD